MKINFLHNFFPFTQKKKKQKDLWDIKFVMAPMEDVTDVAFREAFAKFSVPGEDFIFFTEFTSADGLLKANKEGYRKVSSRLLFSSSQKPVVAQIFSASPENIYKAIKKEIIPRGFDGVDINMGCPDKTIIKQKTGAYLMQVPEIAKEMILKAKEASGGKLPISVKTRVGFNDVDMNWIREILSVKPGALTVHLRSKKELSLVDAHWDLMPEILKIRDEISPNTKIVGNGDIKSLKEAREKLQKYNCDGVMIGRGLFGNPSFFKYETDQREPEEKIKQLIFHLEKFGELLEKENLKPYHVMKKHFKAYINGFSGAKNLREKLMQTTTAYEAIDILKEKLNKL